MHEIIDVHSASQVREKSARTLSLEHFCRQVGRAVEERPACDLPRLVAELLPDLLRLPDLLTPALRRAPADGYGRNPVHICSQDRFSVLAMVWPPGVTTPIHDHRDWCALGVYEGLIEETRYNPVTDTVDCITAVPFETSRLRRGATGHLPVDAPNIHAIHNPTDAVAISIHVYGGNCEKRGPNLGRVFTVA